MKKISIIGGGIAGLTAANALKRAGFYPEVFEAAPEIKAVGAGIVLAANAMKALNHIGLEAEAIKRGKLVPQFTIYDVAGRAIMRTDSTSIAKQYGNDNFAIHRADLHDLLLSFAHDIPIFTRHQAIDFIPKPHSVVIHFKDGTQHETDYLIVADGIHSAIRQKLIPDAKPRYAGYTCWRAVIEAPSLPIEESSETWGSGRRFGIVPIGNNKIYWFACMNASEGDATIKRYTIDNLREYFKDFHTEVTEVLWATQNTPLIHNDLYDLKPLSRFAFGSLLFIGDAAHATTPNLGQGACQAIEDGVILAEMLLKNTNDIPTAFKKFEERRLDRTRYIIQTSRQLGALAQLSHPLLAYLRNGILRSLPESSKRKQFRKLFEVNFE